MKTLLAALLLIVATNVGLGVRVIELVYQPISLLGTETESRPLPDEPEMAAVILPRPFVLGGAFPESQVAAVAAPHRLAGAPEGFPPESNLIVLVDGSLELHWGEREHVIIANFATAKVPENLGVSLAQVLKLTVRCLDKTLSGRTDETPIRIEWKVPPGSEALSKTLPRYLNGISKRR